MTSNRDDDERGGDEFFAAPFMAAVDNDNVLGGTNVVRLVTGLELLLVWVLTALAGLAVAAALRGGAEDVAGDDRKEATLAVDDEAFGALSFLTGNGLVAVDENHEVTPKYDEVEAPADPADWKLAAPVATFCSLDFLTLVESSGTISRDRF